MLNEGFLPLRGPKLSQVAFFAPVPMLLMLLVDFNKQALKRGGAIFEITFDEKTVVSGKTEEGAYMLARGKQVSLDLTHRARK